MTAETEPPAAATILTDDRLGLTMASYAVLLLFLGTLAFGIPGFTVGLVAAAVWGTAYASANRRRGLATGCGLLLLIGVAWTLLVPYPWPISRANETARATQCKNNLKQLMLALHNYHDANGSFPPAVVRDENGQPLYSWRVLLVPYVDQADLYEQIELSQPWDSRQNSTLHDNPVVPFVCPSHSNRTSQFPGTSYFLIVGENAATPVDGGRSLDQFVDSTSQTAMIIESHSRGTHWMEPVDLSLEEALAELTVTPQPAPHRRQEDFNRYPGYRNVALVDGSVIRLPTGLDPRMARQLLQINDGGPAPEEFDFRPSDNAQPVLWRWTCATLFVVLLLLPLAGIWNGPGCAR